MSFGPGYESTKSRATYSANSTRVVSTPPKNKNPPRTKSRAARRAAKIRLEEFRSYINRSGIMDTLTKIFVGLYYEDQKPLKPAEYFYTKLSGEPMSQTRLKALQREKELLEGYLEYLESEHKRLKHELEPYGPKRTVGFYSDPNIKKIKDEPNNTERIRNK